MKVSGLSPAPCNADGVRGQPTDRQSARGVEGSLDIGLGQIDAIELYNPSSSRVILPPLCLLQTHANGAIGSSQSVLGQNDPNERTIEAHGTLVLCTLIGPAGPYQTTRARPGARGM